MKNTDLAMNNGVLEERLEKHQNEIKELESAIARLDGKIHDLKPTVVEYNEKMRERKDLRKQLGAKQRETKVLAEFFTGTTIIDERFPLFAVHSEENHNSQ